MKKLLLCCLGGLLLLAVVGYLTLQFFLGSIVKAGVNKFGPGITQTSVELQGAAISPLSGVGTLSGLTVGNPPGWSAHNAFHLGQVHIAMEPFSVFHDHIVINEISIDQPEFLYETKIVASNIGDLLKNIEQAVGRGAAAQPTTKTGQPIRMEIKKLVMHNGRVTVGLGGQAITMPLPPIDMTDIGTAEGGVTPAQVAVAVMRNVTTQVVGASTSALTKMGGTSGAAAADAARQAGDAIKGFFSPSKKN